MTPIFATPARSTYRGRFAPSPSGNLHFGSLLAAVASYADARAHQGQWLLRIEDIDQERSSSQARREIPRTLVAFGMHWDGDIIFQHQRFAIYRTAVTELLAQDQAYWCGCTRSEIKQLAIQSPEGDRYPGTCRAGIKLGHSPRVVRFRVPTETISFDDRVQGIKTVTEAESGGDFILQRFDGSPSYQLAVTLDDAEQGITDIIRGADLLIATPRQIMLQCALKLPECRYAHIPLIYDQQGKKLCKSRGAAALDTVNPLPQLKAAWALLGQVEMTAVADIANFWQRAIPAWQIERVPRHLISVMP